MLTLCIVCSQCLWYDKRRKGFRYLGAIPFPGVFQSKVHHRRTDGLAHGNKKGLRRFLQVSKTSSTSTTSTSMAIVVVMQHRAQ